MTQIKNCAALVMISLVLATSPMTVEASSKTDTPFPSGFAKWDLDCHTASIEVRNKGLLNTTPSGQERSEGEEGRLYDFCHPVEMSKAFPQSYRQLHVTLYNVFYARRMDIRQQALARLKTYKCENKIVCAEYRALLDTLTKAHSLSWKSNTLEEMLAQLRQIHHTLASRPATETTPPPGLCQTEAEIRKETKKIIESALQAYCPLNKTASGSTCGSFQDAQNPCTSLHWLQEDLSIWSGQASISSSRLAQIKLSAERDCNEPFLIQFSCDRGAESKTWELAYRCQKRKSGEISCEIPPLTRANSLTKSPKIRRK